MDSIKKNSVQKLFIIFLSMQSAKDTLKNITKVVVIYIQIKQFFITNLLLKTSLTLILE